MILKITKYINKNQREENKYKELGEMGNENT